MSVQQQLVAVVLVVVPVVVLVVVLGDCALLALALALAARRGKGRPTAVLRWRRREEVSLLLAARAIPSYELVEVRNRPEHWNHLAPSRNRLLICDFRLCVGRARPAGAWGTSEGQRPGRREDGSAYGAGPPREYPS